MGPASEFTNTGQSRIYVACLAAYNNGILHGAWINAHQDAEAICTEVSRMLRASPIPEAEEWAIHDHEGFEGVYIAEYEGIESVAETAAFIAQHGKLGADLIDYFGEVEEARDAMENRYLGVYADLADYMQSMTEECLTIPANIRYYIDWTSMARDAEINGELFTIRAGYDEIHVFAGC